MTLQLAKQRAAAALEERNTNDTQYRRGLGLNKAQAGVGGKPTETSGARQ